MNLILKLFAFLTVLFTTNSCVTINETETNLSQPSQSDGVVTRAAFDLGSGSFRMKIATIDTKRQKVLEYVQVPDELAEVKLDGAQDLKNSKTGKFSQSYQVRVIESLTNMADFAKKSGAKELIAVGTAAFRDAKNGPELAKRIHEATGIDVRIISAAKESLLGYFGGQAATGVAKANLVVWDIGGKSMQIAYLDANNKLQYYSGKTASVMFKNQIIENIQKKDPTAIKSPNPMSPSDKTAALVLAKQAAKEVPDNIKAKLADPSTVVVGIGGVHYYSVAGQLGKVKEYTADSVIALSDKRIKQKMNDQALATLLNTSYADTEVSNLILVQGFMDVLKINKVRVVKVNNSDGLLVAPVALLVD